MKRAVFLDRDGVLNLRRLLLVRRPHELIMIPGAPQAAARLSQAGFAVAIVTNQEWVSRGYIQREDHDEIMALSVRAIEDAGGKVERAYAALDSSNAKPKPDMLLQGAREMGVDLAASFMVGDNAKDVEAGRAAGCKTILVDPRFRTRWQKASPDHVARDLEAAAEWILAQR